MHALHQMTPSEEGVPKITTLGSQFKDSYFWNSPLLRQHSTQNPHPRHLSYYGMGPVGPVPPRKV